MYLLSGELPLRFEWNEEKRHRTIRERGVDIIYAALIFEGAVLRSVDQRRDYGERREIAVGLVDGECFVVILVERGDVIRLITAWKGGRRVRERYAASLAGRDPADEGGRGPAP